MNLKFLLSKREESRFIYYAIFQIIQLFTSLSLSLTFHKRKREKEKGDAGPVNCHLEAEPRYPGIPHQPNSSRIVFLPRRFPTTDDVTSYFLSSNPGIRICQNVPQE